MSLTTKQLIDELTKCPPGTEVVVPSFRKPTEAMTQINRVEHHTNMNDESILVLIPESMVAFWPVKPA